MKKNNLALSFCLVAYVGLVGGVWAYTSCQAGAMLPLPEDVLYIGMVLVGAQTGESVFTKHRLKEGKEA